MSLWCTIKRQHAWEQPLRYKVSGQSGSLSRLPNCINPGCSKACDNFKNATIFDKLSSQDHGYEYCDLWPVTNEIDFTGCKQCLAVDHLVLSNCLSALLSVRR